MCGIAGYIGKSKYRDVSFSIMTELFAELDIRGDDAAGWWGTDNTRVYYHKEPIKSSNIIQKPCWNNLASADIDLLLVHARGASIGVGHPSININNHPFTSTDYKIGMVHNGRIPDYIYRRLLKNYTTFSECDSEIILRIFESSENHDKEKLLEDFPDTDINLAKRLHGAQQVWNKLQGGAMAVAIGEWSEGEKNLWLFRNEYRELWMADLRDLLGQIFFFSTPEIWFNAISNSNQTFIFPDDKIKLEEISTKELYLFNMNENDPVVNDENITIFDWVCDYSDNEKEIGIIDKNPTVEVVSWLNYSDEILEDENIFPINERLLMDERNLHQLNESIENIKEMLTNFEIDVYNKYLEGSLHENDIGLMAEEMAIIEQEIKEMIDERI